MEFFYVFVVVMKMRGHVRVAIDQVIVCGVCFPNLDATIDRYRFSLLAV
jgi:hypothetical protein